MNLFTDANPAIVVAMTASSGVSAELAEGPDRSLDERLTRDILCRAAVRAGAATTDWSLSRMGAESRRRAVAVALLTIVETP